MTAQIIVAEYGNAAEASEVLARPASDLPNERFIMKIVVIGGTGLIGSKLVTQLTEHGHEAVPASPNSGVNTLTGEGLADVLSGADVVVDVSNSPSFEDAAVLEFFETSTRNLLAAESRRRRRAPRRPVGRRAPTACPTAATCGPRSRRRS